MVQWQADNQELHQISRTPAQFSLGRPHPHPHELIILHVGNAAQGVSHVSRQVEELETRLADVEERLKQIAKLLQFSRLEDEVGHIKSMVEQLTQRD